MAKKVDQQSRDRSAKEKHAESSIKRRRKKQSIEHKRRKQLISEKVRQLKIKHKKMLEKPAITVGPRGGQITGVSGQGHKEYQTKKPKRGLKMKKALIDSITNELNKKDLTKEELVKSIASIIEKATDSTSADVTNKPADEATVNGENTPVIQEATTPSKIELEGQPEVKEMIAPTNPVEHNTNGGASKQVSFGNLFQKQYVLGSTLDQGPTGNVMSNMKTPTMDYVERAKNHGNEAISAEELANLKNNGELKKES